MTKIDIIRDYMLLHKYEEPTILMDLIWYDYSNKLAKLLSINKLEKIMHRINKGDKQNKPIRIVNVPKHLSTNTKIYKTKDLNVYKLLNELNDKEVKHYTKFQHKQTKNKIDNRLMPSSLQMVKQIKTPEVKQLFLTNQSEILDSILLKSS